MEIFLAPGEKRMLELLIKHLSKVRPGDAKTHLGYAQVHEMLGLRREATTWGRSLQIQGLENIARWAISSGAPAITGLVVNKDPNKPQLPADGFFNVHGRHKEDFKFWIDQMQAAKSYDWISLLTKLTGTQASDQGEIGRGDDWLVEVTWDEGLVELLDLTTVNEKGAWITTEETWAKSSLPKTTVQYRAFAIQRASRSGLSYEIEYRENEQFNPLTLKHSRFGRSRITLNESGQGEAEWEDRQDHSLNGPALRMRVVERPLPNEGNAGSEIVNELSLTRFLATLGCDLRLGWYWSAAAKDKSRVIFTVWADQIDDGKYVLLPKEDVYWSRLPGAYELRRHFPIAQTAGVEVYGVLCYPFDDSAKTRKRKYFNEHEMVRLRIEQLDGAWIAHIIDLVRVTDLQAGLIVPLEADAYVDVEPPPGTGSPIRVPTDSGSRYLRDAMVRQFVLARANGHCEYCGKPGFVMENGRPYLECHHVEGLARGGPDSVANVIALCPNDHRRAHYGLDALQVNADMLLRIAEQNNS
jgi:5-methylcytosine-specific restriction enzyme A